MAITCLIALRKILSAIPSEPAPSFTSINITMNNELNGASLHRLGDVIDTMNNRIHFDHTLKLRLHTDEVEFRVLSASRSVFYYRVDLFLRKC